jgi:hypothetical protein
MTSVKIVQSVTETELHINGEFVAAWSKFEIPKEIELKIMRMLECCIREGKDIAKKEICSTFGIAAIRQKKEDIPTARYFGVSIAMSDGWSDFVISTSGNFPSAEFIRDECVKRYKRPANQYVINTIFEFKSEQDYKQYLGKE